MTAATEPLRLFSDTPSDDEGQSRIETHYERPAEEALHAVSRAAARLVAAESGFDRAVETARRAGTSWRRIAAAAGVPFQTLHRKHRGE